MAKQPTNPYNWARQLQDTPQWEYLKTTPVYYTKSIYRQIMSKNIFLWGQAIAFKVLIAVVPIIILATGILSRAYLGSERAFDEVAKLIRGFLPQYPSLSEQFITFLRDLQSASSTLTIIGSIGLFLSAMTLFTTLRLTISNVFAEEWNEDRAVLPGYLFDCRMVIQVGLLFVLTLSISIAIQTLNVAGMEFIAGLGLDQIWVRRGWRRAIQAAGYVLPFLLTTAMFFQLFYFTPLPHPPKRCALKGALVTAVLWEIAKYSFTLYATHGARFERYTGEGGSFVMGTAFMLIIAFVIWAYFSGVVLMIGATIAMLSEKRYRSRRRAEKAAEHEAQAESEDEPSAPPPSSKRRTAASTPTTPNPQPG